jgi:hypothetical protein
MSKQQVNVSIDSEVAENIKERFSGQVSSICEKAMRVKLGQSITAIKNERLCFRCKEPKANIWDGIYECWVCDKCNNQDVKKVSIMCSK